MRVDGHTLYKYKSIGHVPLIRENVVRIGYAKMELGLRPEDLKVYTDMVTDAGNEGSMARILQLTGFLQMQLENFASERIALEVGGYMVLADDEPHDEITDRHNEIKAKLLQYPAVRDFFLSESVGLMLSLNDSINPSLMLGSLKDPTRRKKEEMFLSLMGLDMFKGLWTPLTPPPSGWQKRLAVLVQRMF